MAAKAKTTAPLATDSATTKAPSKLTTIENLLSQESGTTIAEMCEATGWQQHSVRGAMAGALKKRGLAVTSVKTDDVRRYHASRR